MRLPARTDAHDIADREIRIVGGRDRADRLYRDSVNVRGLPQEKDQLSRAASDYNQALNLYQEIAPYGKAAQNIRRVEQSIAVGLQRDRQPVPAAPAARSVPTVNSPPAIPPGSLLKFDVELIKVKQPTAAVPGAKVPSSQ